jgi:hypothetical protein
MLTDEKVRLWNSTKDGEPCALKGARTVRGGGHAKPARVNGPYSTPQSPVVEPHTHRYRASEAVPSRACRSSFAVRTLRVVDDVQRAHARG